MTALTAAINLTAAVLLGLPAVGASASAGQNAAAAPMIEETFVLKHLKPSALVTFLTQDATTARAARSGSAAPRSTSALLTDSIKSVTPDDVFNTVTIQGSPESIAAIRKVATLLDVPPRPVRLAVRIIRYRSSAAQKLGGAGITPVADVEEVASGVVETSSNTPVELTTYGNRHTFRARLIPHINNDTSVSVAADLQMASAEGSFVPFPRDPSGTRLLRIGDRGLITSVGSGISSASVASAPAVPKAADAPEKTAPETYYLEAIPTFPPAAATGSEPPPAAKP
jgi:hypothetical protein